MTEYKSEFVSCSHEFTGFSLVGKKKIVEKIKDPGLLNYDRFGHSKNMSY